MKKCDICGGKRASWFLVEKAIYASMCKLCVMGIGAEWLVLPIAAPTKTTKLIKSTHNGR